MAVVHVSNWTDFKTAITGDGNTVILDSDLDANGDIITDRIYVHALEIDGQGHTIYNYTSTHNGSDFFLEFFYDNRYITCNIKNLNFYNIVIGGSNTSEGMFYAYRGAFILTNCRLQGNINKALILNSEMHQCSCTFNKLRLIGGISDSNVIEECWFDIGNNVIPNNSGAYYQGRILYSYFIGSLDTKGLSNNSSIFFRCSCKSSIFNIELSDTSEDIKTIRLNDRVDSEINLYNTDKISFPANVTFETQSNFTGLSDASLKSPEAVNATGFSPFVMWGANRGNMVLR